MQARGWQRARCFGLTAVLAATALAIIVPTSMVGAQSASITSAKTVGLDPNLCATASTLTLPPEGGEVTYCYEVTNTGDVAFDVLDLVDSELGVVLNSLAYSLAPGTSVFVTQSALLNTTTTNVATWNATSIAPSVVVTSTDSALVTVTPAAPGLTLDKTVGTDPNACAASASLVLPPGGGMVVYCYRATNTGNVTFTSHDLVDSEIGTLLNDFAYSLAPSASVFLTATAVITETTDNIAAWTASSITPTTTITETASARVTVTPPNPAIDLVKTVGTDPDACATTSAIILPPGGGTVVYCYEVTNTGNVPLTLHDLTDDQLGAILSSFPYTLTPGGSVLVTKSATLTQTTVNAATWTASGEGVGDATANDEATVTVMERQNIPTLSTSALLVFALLMCAAGLLILRRLS